MTKGYVYECPFRKECPYEFQHQLCDDEDYSMCIHYDIMEEEFSKQYNKNDILI